MSFPLPQGPFASRPHTGWCIEVGFAYFQMDYVFTLLFKGLRTLKHIHYYKRSDFFGTFGNHAWTLKGAWRTIAASA